MSCNKVTQSEAEQLLKDVQESDNPFGVLVEFLLKRVEVDVDLETGEIKNKETPSC